jgi:serine/threonine-protein kinase
VLNTPSLTTPHAVVGTPHYMSPEAFHGATANPAADVYALGVLLYEMVSGRPPYDSDNVAELMRKHLEGDPERRPGIPDRLWEIIQSCLAQKPRLRPTAAELVAELSAVARVTASTPALPRPDPRIPEPQPEAEAQAEDAPDRPRHPSAIIPAPRGPRRRNQVPSWRWARPGASLALIVGAMLASGVATTAWHLGRAEGDPGAAHAAGSAAPTPRAQLGSSAPAASAPPAPAPASAAQAVGGTLPAAATHNPLPVRAIPRPTATPARTKPPVKEAKPYGPWQCQQALQFTYGTPVLVNPCHALGSRVQMKAAIAAPNGGQATVTVSLRDVATGRTVAGPKTCGGIVFVNRNAAHDCGPVTVTVPHGHTYAVVMTWTYNRSGQPVNGATKGKDFTW